jgi:succinoglycan biosynthesis transport protein ExoP
MTSAQRPKTQSRGSGSSRAALGGQRAAVSRQLEPNSASKSVRADSNVSPVVAASPSSEPPELIPEELAESLRGVYSRHELSTGSAFPKWIAVTSSLEGEGVTTVSRALAALLAQEFGQRVCWFDCEWLSSSTRAVEEPARRTLSELAEDMSALSRTFEVSTNIPSLRYLRPGLEPTGLSNPVVRSPQFGTLLARLDADFDHIILDMPPILSNSGTLALMLCADATLIVVKHRSTSMSMLERTLQATQPTPNLAVLLNRFKPSIPKRLLRMFSS